MKALDLFCGAGGVSVGLERAGFEVTGVDIRPQPRYRGGIFVQADALTFPLDGYDLIWASPPCQAHTALRGRWPDREYPNLIPETRERLVASGAPWVMENVVGAPLRRDLLLCGTMFDLRVYRHRVFEASFALAQPEHPKHLIRAGGHKSQRQRKAHFLAGGFVTVTGNVGRYAGAAMGIDWMSGDELSQAIPPAYAQYVGEQAMAYLIARKRKREPPGNRDWSSWSLMFSAQRIQETRRVEMEIEEVLIQAEIRDLEEALRLVRRWEGSGIPLPAEFGLLRWNTAGFPQFLIYARRGDVTIRRAVDVVVTAQLDHLRWATLEIAKSLAEATLDKKETPQETERTDRV